MTAYSVEVQRVKEEVRSRNSASQGLEKLPRPDTVDVEESGRKRPEATPLRERRIYDDIEMRKKMAHLGEFLGYDGFVGIKMLGQMVRKW